MPKLWMPFALAGAFLALNGCGGSSDSSPETFPAGEELRYTATLPDGSPMVLVVETNANGVWRGAFAVAAEEGPYAHQSGFFMGKVSGNQLEATCHVPDGTTFEIEGTSQGASGLTLTRSDIGGQALAFRTVAPALTGNRAPVSFLLTTGGTNGRVTIDSVPASVTTVAGTSISEHKGTWQGVPVIFWAYSSGTANLTIYIDPMCVSSQVFSNYRLSDFGTKTVQAGTGQMTMYSSVVRSQIKYKVAPTVSP